MLVELVTMPPCHGGGHGFESRMSRQRGITCVGASGDCSPTTLYIAPSYNGSTADFGSANGGSNPPGVTKLKK